MIEKIERDFQVSGTVKLVGYDIVKMIENLNGFIKEFNKTNEQSNKLAFRGYLGAALTALVSFFAQVWNIARQT